MRLSAVVGKRRELAIFVSLAAVSMLMFAAPALASPKYTAKECVYSNSQCLWSGTSLNGLQAYDDAYADNHTLDQWAYYGTHTEIANDIGSVEIISTGDTVSYYTGDNKTGSHFNLTNPSGGSSLQELTGSYAGYRNKIYSFYW